jgi:hypothetical protein
VKTDCALGHAQLHPNALIRPPLCQETEHFGLTSSQVRAGGLSEWPAQLAMANLHQPARDRCTKPSRTRGHGVDSLDEQVRHIGRDEIACPPSLQPVAQIFFGWFSRDDQRINPRVMVAQGMNII